MIAASPPGGTARVCPLLVGRDDELAFAVRRRDAAAAGHGGLLLIGGEAGIGKSRLLDELTTVAGGRVVRAEVFAGDRDTPGLLLNGLASGFRAAGDAETADRLHALVADAVTALTADSARRRLLVAELAETLTRALATPFLVRLEDLHWADQLSLDALRRAAASLDRLPSLVVATHRTDDAGVDAAFTSWRLDLLAHRQAEELLLARLGREGTRAMLASITGEPPAAEDVDRLHAAADGIPLHVEELVAVGVDAVPETVGDAVVARTLTLGQDARAAIAAAAVIGREFDAEALGAVMPEDADTSPAGLDAALDELVRVHFVVPSGAGFDFRHALIRDAVYASLPAQQRRLLHGRVVDAVPGLSDAVRSAHLERAGRADQAYRASRAAAARASALSAHREAVGLYRRAERTVPSGTAVAERAELHRLLGAELAASDANEDAEREFSRAVELFREAGDEVAAAAATPSLVAARHLLGADYLSRAATLREALDRLGPAGDAEHDRVRGALLAALAAAAMLDRRLDESLAFAVEARPLLEDDVAERLAVDVTRGAVLVFAGRDEGWDLLDSSAREAAASGLEATAARAYRMAGSSASVLLVYERGMEWLREGIAYASRIERWNDAHYLQAHLAHVHWATGRLDEAWTGAERARADGRGGITTEVTALHVLGYVALARGDLGPAERLLAEAAEIGERMQELQRLSPALWGLAEAAVARGDAAAAADLAERGYRESARVSDAAYLFPFLVTGARARLAAGDVTGAREWVERAGERVRDRGIPGTEHAIAHAQGLVALAERGITRAKELLTVASAGWDGLGRWWEGSQALLDLAECARRSRSPAEASALVARARARAEEAGAGALLARVETIEERLAAGVETTVLSAREREVAALVATGATNREIGASLHISPRTVATHVEHILAKLGATRRSEIAAWSAAERLPG